MPDNQSTGIIVIGASFLAAGVGAALLLKGQAPQAPPAPTGCTCPGCCPGYTCLSGRCQVQPNPTTGCPAWCVAPNYTCQNGACLTVSHPGGSPTKTIQGVEFVRFVQDIPCYRAFDSIGMVLAVTHSGPAGYAKVGFRVKASGENNYDDSGPGTCTYLFAQDVYLADAPQGSTDLVQTNGFLWPQWTACPGQIQGLASFDFSAYAANDTTGQSYFGRFFAGEIIGVFAGGSCPGGAPPGGGGGCTEGQYIGTCILCRNGQPTDCSSIGQVCDLNSGMCTSRPPPPIPACTPATCDTLSCFNQCQDTPGGSVCVQVQCNDDSCCPSDRYCEPQVGCIPRTPPAPNCDNGQYVAPCLLCVSGGPVTCDMIGATCGSDGTCIASPFF